MSSFADLRARLAAVQHRAIETTSPGMWPRITRVVDAPVPDGFTMWARRPRRRPVTVLPDLTEDAPLDIRFALSPGSWRRPPGGARCAPGWPS